MDVDSMPAPAGSAGSAVVASASSDLISRTMEAFNDAGLALSQVPDAAIAAFYRGEVNPADVENIRTLMNDSTDGAMQNLFACLQGWLSPVSSFAKVAAASQASAADNMWIMLAEEGISYKPLVLVLYAIIETQDPTALLAARVYLTMLKINGTIAV